MTKLSRPYSCLALGILTSILIGSLMPVIGIFLGKMLFVLQPSPINPYPQIRSDSDLNCLFMFLVAVGSFIAGFL